MKCLILSAGKGTRLQPRYNCKPLAPVLGIPLIERVIRTAVCAGVEEFYVVTGHKEAEVSQFLDQLTERCQIPINHIHNNEWDKGGNGLSALKAKAHLNESFLLMMGDHLADPKLLKDLLQNRLSDGDIIVAVDRNVDTAITDIRDATKVLIHDGKVKSIGKNLKRFDALDTGLFLCTPTIFEGIEQSISKHDDSTLTGGIRRLSENGSVKVFDIGQKFWIDVDNPVALKKAEGVLLSQLRGKQSDGPISRYLNRLLSTRLSRYLARFPITPNQISFISFLLCIFATGLFLGEGYVTLLFGGIIAQFASVLDGCDGEIARLKFQESAYGKWFDAVLDRYADGFLLFGLTWHAYMTDTQLASVVAGFMAILGSFMVSYTADKYDALMISHPKWHVRIGRDIRIFLIFLGALLNQVLWTLVVIAFLMNAETIRRVYVCKTNE
ncbi:MAG: NTP transferase domain-containing protein [Deltaproteobacteria bacterium]|nr:NTP transferase domain-containing protein [Deltaproteobacteria bacterium]MBW2077715.1 NTP transferase domain-containing protein [Deltaproteobacteria bacterium]RLC12455.1 MAG: hypothetical protein DRH43_01525 [Deltaproteobacteria bacterium]